MKPMALFVVMLAGALSAGAEPAVGLRVRLDSIFGHPDFRNAVWACVFADTTNGAMLYARNAELPVVPASNQKLYVAAAALLQLGANYRPCTEFVAQGPLREGVLAGDLLVRGNGAFCLTSRFPRHRPIEARRAVLAVQLDGVAERLKAVGAGRVRGRLLASRAPWTDMGVNARYHSADALLFNENTLDIDVTNGVVRCCPARLHQFRIDGTRDPIAQARVMERGLPTDTIRVNPRMPQSGYWRLEHGDPAEYYAACVEEALTLRGIRFDGAAPAASPIEERLLFRLPGLSVAEILPGMLTHSDNLRAEVLLLNLGYAGYGRANYANGARACLEALRSKGLATRVFHPVDGCGLSLENRIGCGETVQVLRRLAAAPVAGAFRTALAVSGTTGSLEDRLQTPALKGRIQAKTGTLSSVTALSGYARTNGGRDLCFSMVCNRIPDGERCWQAIAEALTQVCGSE